MYFKKMLLGWEVHNKFYETIGFIDLKTKKFSINNFYREVTLEELKEIVKFMKKERIF